MPKADGHNGVLSMVAKLGCFFAVLSEDNLNSSEPAATAEAESPKILLPMPSANALASICTEDAFADIAPASCSHMPDTSPRIPIEEQNGPAREGNETPQITGLQDGMSCCPSMVPDLPFLVRPSELTMAAGGMQVAPVAASSL